MVHEWHFYSIFERLSSSLNQKTERHLAESTVYLSSYWIVFVDMAKTKQTAVWSTGRKSPRKQLAVKAEREIKPVGANRAARVSRWRLGTVDLREICKLQKSTELLSPSFANWLRVAWLEFTSRLVLWMRCNTLRRHSLLTCSKKRSWHRYMRNAWESCKRHRAGC